MKRYMIVYVTPIDEEMGWTERETHATFADTYKEAHNKALDLECGLGCYTQLYELVVDEMGAKEYQLVREW